MKRAGPTFRLAVLGAAIASFLVTASPSLTAQLVTRDARRVQLAANGRGQALLTYRTAATLRRVLLWGAIDAHPPRAGAKQAEFKLDYVAALRRYRASQSRSPRGCNRYDGPKLAYRVAACKAPDGTYWSVQRLPQSRAPLAFASRVAGRGSSWLEVSHWSGELAKVETGTAWAYSGRFQLVYGRFTYRGRPVYGFGSTKRGAPTDGFGRAVYLDTFNSTSGRGWHRKGSFLTHRGTGAFCYGLWPSKLGYPHSPGLIRGRGPAIGEKYRLTVSGPGVTPIVVVTAAGSHDFDESNPADVAQQRRAARRLRSWGVRTSDKDCRPVLKLASALEP